MQNTRKLYALSGILMSVTALVHTLGNLVAQPDTAQEKSVLASMDSLHFAMGMGMTPSLGGIYWALVFFMSATLVGLGLLNLAVWRKGSTEVVRSAMWVNLLWVAALIAISWYAQAPPPLISGAAIQISVVACLLVRP